jgi:hypothetical protein
VVAIKVETIACVLAFLFLGLMRVGVLVGGREGL